MRRCWTAGGDVSTGCESASETPTLSALFLRLLLVDWHDLIGVFLCAIGIDIFGVPDELLEELVVVLLEDDLAGGVDDIAGVLDQLAARGRERLGVDGGVVEDVLEGVVDLLVCGHAAMTECFDDSVKTDLGRDQI